MLVFVAARPSAGLSCVRVCAVDGWALFVANTTPVLSVRYSCASCKVVESFRKAARGVLLIAYAPLNTRRPDDVLKGMANPTIGGVPGAVASTSDTTTYPSNA